MVVPMRTRIVSAAVALPLAVAAVFANAPSANAVDAGTIVSAVKQAYDAYKMLTQTHQLTLDEATTRIIDAVNAAKAETIKHIDQIATDDVQACATSAVIDFEDLQRFNLSNQQAFARDASYCVALAQTYINTVNDPGEVDQLGFAVNVVGPIALIARSYLGLSTGTLTKTLIAADNTIVAKLNPRCSTTTYPEFNSLGKPIPSLALNVLTCKAYNGGRGQTEFVGKMPPGGPNYTVARTQAARGISYSVAVAALAQLNS
jgi:Skp family chaperone for outer membrane proteins